MFVITDKRHDHWGLASALSFETLKGAEDYAKTLMVTFGSVSEFCIYELSNPVIVKRREEVVAANL